MLITYAIDVGSTKPSKGAALGRFGWARVTSESTADPHVGRTLDGLTATMGRDARAGVVATLGVEAPLWLPAPDDEGSLSEGRHGEGSRSCFAPAGGYVATLGLHQLAHLMRRLPAQWTPTLDWRGWKRGDTSALLIWEAFVSQDAHAGGDDPQGHVRDAATAALEFARRSDNLVTDVRPDARSTLSLAGVAILWSGRGSDVALLRAPTLVVRPKGRFEGRVDEV